MVSLCILIIQPSDEHSQVHNSVFVNITDEDATDLIDIVGYCMLIHLP